jgi:hypothetical protein
VVGRNQEYTLQEELAKLKARVAELERANKPPEPFKPEPYQRYDPTAGMSMPRSVMQEMAAAIPDHVVRNIAMRDNRAPTGPSSQGAIPSSQQVSNVRGTGGVPGGGTGWAHEVPLSPDQRHSLREWIDPKAREQAALKAKP